MNPKHQRILDFVEATGRLSAEENATLVKMLLEADKALNIAEFKLDRTEKVKRTTGILLEETIAELEEKRAAIEQTNAALNQSLEELKATQAQLIQSEKMASLGELTAGIAHEIQNPLNFVNNFSEVSSELITEAKEELQRGEIKEAREILNDLNQNLKKINQHGKRASSIVKGMLDHSRTSSGEQISIDINQLCEEYVRLAYHGMRAKHKNFRVRYETDFQEELPSVKVVPQDIGRVILNLVNNALQACHVKSKADTEKYEPMVKISTRGISVAGRNQGADCLKITIADNGPGILNEIKDKIFQPFFTTKPTGQGTGLGLSLSYDIVKAHGGQLEVSSEVGIVTQFTIMLPMI